MSEERKIQRSHRLCPCSATDIEGIQSWLEDLAREGLILEQESVFFGFWSFEKTAPRKVQYRLEVVRSGFLEDSDCPRQEMVETAEAMGWEYVTRYRSFYIYRSFDPQARPLHTDPAVQGLTVKALRRQQYTDLILGALYLFLIFFLRRSSFGFLFLDAAMLGPLYALCALGFFLALVIEPFSHVYFLHRAGVKLKKGEALEAQKPWKRKAPLWIAGKILPVILAAVMLGGLFSTLILDTARYPLEGYTGNALFPTIQEVYPEGTVTQRTDMGDYNTYHQWENGISRNTEWNESGSITVDGTQYHFILRLTCYETKSNWFARNLARDCYTQDATRYSGKRFEELEAPETDLELLQVYSSYGIRYILLRQGSTVIHGTVSITHGQETDLWQDWLQAAVNKLNGHHYLIQSLGRRGSAPYGQCCKLSPEPIWFRGCCLS